MAERDKISREIEDSPFRHQLEELIYISKRLRTYGSYILIGLVLSLIFLATYVVLLRRLYHSEDFIMIQVSLFAWLYALLTIIFGIFMLYRFNTLRNKGMIIYDEITEEIDWSSKRKEFIHRPPIETRIVIKEFLKAADLPFTSGSNGQAFYLILYILISIATIILMAIIGR